METKKTPFFIRLKRAIFNFDEYKTFSEEKTSFVVKYILKLVLVFTIIIIIALTWKVIHEVNILINEFANEWPEFSFQNNILTIEADDKEIIKGDENGYFGLIINSEEESLDNIEEAGDYQRIIAILKDKIIIISADNVVTSTTYEELSQNYDLESINKETLLEYISGINTSETYALLAIVVLIVYYIVYIIEMIIDILLLSIVGYLFSKIIGVKLKYKSVFNMSPYALTLSIILYMVYIIINMLTGFTIKYFEIAYNAIAYIYIITAMLMMKSDMVKQQVEVGKIVQEQKKIREEKQKEKEDEEKQNKEKPKDKKTNENKKDDTKKKEKKDKKEKNEGQTPQGNNA